MRKTILVGVESPWCLLCSATTSSDISIAFTFVYYIYMNFPIINSLYKLIKGKVL